MCEERKQELIKELGSLTKVEIYFAKILEHEGYTVLNILERIAHRRQLELSDEFNKTDEFNKWLDLENLDG